MDGAWYVGRASWRRGWLGLVFLGVLAGVIGGAVLGALGGARRTASAYDRLLRASGAPHEAIFVTERVPEFEEWLRRSPLVERVAPAAGMIGRRAPQQDWYSLDAPVAGEFGPAVIERGRLPDPDRADEVYVTLRTAQNAGLRVGDEVIFDAYDASQTRRLLADPWTKPAGGRIKARVVGIARDPTDAQLSQTIKLMFGTPAFAREHRDAATFRLLGVWLKGGPDAEPEFERELAQFARSLSGDELPFSIASSRSDAESADHAAGAVVTGLLIFALVAGLAGLVTITQTVRRDLVRRDEEAAVLTALGADRTVRTMAQVVGALPYLLIAPVVAVAVAYAASPLFPLGAVRALEPQVGLRADPLVLVAGGMLWLLVLGGLTMLVAWVGTARPASRSRAHTTARFANLTAGTAALPALLGARFGLQSGTRRRVMRRTAFAGVILAVVGVVGSIVFASSLDHLTTSPSRFGLTFDLSLEMPADGAPAVLAQLAADDNLSALAVSREGLVDLEGRQLNAYSIEPRKGTLEPTVHTGRLPANDREIALGPKLLHELDRDIGDQVRLTSRAGPRAMTIVGTVLSPVSESAEFNEEAFVTPAALDAYSTNPVVAALVRVRDDADEQAMFAKLDARFPYAISDESRPHAPGPIRNLQQIARLPLALALFFGFFGAAAIAQSILVTAAERRKDFAVLRGIGFTRRQVVAVLVGAAVSVAVVALAVGVPLGLLAGRVGWRAVAGGLFVGAAPAMPFAAIALVGLGLAAFSSLIALASGRVVLRRRPGPTLRTE